MEFRFDYLNCENCEKGNECRKCEDILTEKLLLEPEIRQAGIQMDRRILTVVSELELPELEEIYRMYGILVH